MPIERLRMKILMIARATLYSSPGGDTVQIESTAKYLRQLGVDVHIMLSSDMIDYEKYDLIHFFNIIRPDDILPHITLTNIPYVISTIFVDYDEYEKKNRKGVLGMLMKVLSADKIEYLKALARWVKNGDRIHSKYYIMNGHRAAILKAVSGAQMLLPNSHSEYQRFEAKYGISCKYMKVPNAIETGVFSGSIAPNDAFSEHVLCVGRIEGRKNQLALIKAITGTNIKLSIIGKPSPNHQSYYEECKRLVADSDNIQIIEHLSHSELSAIYKAAKVHVLPSWFETTGLSSLEAAVMGCNIVVTDKGDTREYFGDLAYYCDPEDIGSIKTAVLSAYREPRGSSLRDRILDNYTWQKAAEATLKAYQEVLIKN